jgi:hypothetical protein
LKSAAECDGSAVEKRDFTSRDFYRDAPTNPQSSERGEQVFDAVDREARAEDLDPVIGAPNLESSHRQSTERGTDHHRPFRTREGYAAWVPGVKPDAPERLRHFKVKAHVGLSSGVQPATPAINV